MNKSTLFLSAAIALSPLISAPVFGQASPYRGLWVGEIKLDGVNEVSVPLDANNIPRAPNPAVTTPTFDAANLRLILHVNGAGQVNLLKQVAVLNRKAGALKSENDLALVTDERLYGNFPPQPAQRFASVVFDFGDAKATQAVDAVVNAAANAAGDYFNSVSTGTTAATATELATAKGNANSAAATVVTNANAAKRYSDFLRDYLNSAAVTAIGTGTPVTPAQTNAASQLKTGSFYQDKRGENFLAALTSLPTTGTTAERTKAAQNVASTYADVDNNYQRFLAGELFGDMIGSAASAAGVAAALVPRKEITGTTGTANSSPVVMTSADHQLTTGNKISISDSAIAAYNGVFTVSRVDADHFSLPANFVAGKPISEYAATSQLAPLTVVSPGHGLSTGTTITISGAGTAAYNGAFTVTVIDADSFTVPATYSNDPTVHGNWTDHAGVISDYESAPGGVSGVKITSSGHGLNNGDTIQLFGSGAAVYNGARTITRVDANSFTIPVAFGGNPAVKGSWAVQHSINAFEAPTQHPTTVTSSGPHGLATGDKIIIGGAGNPIYNDTFTVTVLSPTTFEIPVIFPAAEGNPTSKGAWTPEVGGSWRSVETIHTAVEGTAKVNDARTEALRVKVTAYADTRGTDAIAIVLNAIETAAANSAATNSSEIQRTADAAGRLALVELVARSNLTDLTPTADYTAFVTASTATFVDFSELAAIVDAAAAAGAAAEKTNPLKTLDSLRNKAKEAIIAAIPSVYSAAARALRPELLMSGGFGPGVTGLKGTIVLPANHPTNPFRHRRHPDHTTGFDITRILTLSFDGAAGDSLGNAGYGVKSITGLYDEEIFGLHKPLGPSKSIGLKVHGTFFLQRISLIDTLNAR